MRRSAIVICFFLFVSLCVLEIYAKKLEIPLVRKHHKNHPEFLHKRTSTSSELPMYGSSTTLGEYYFDFTVGTPPQSFSAQLDTGSSDVAIPAVGCPDCGPHPDPYFNPYSSSTFNNISCDARDDGLYCPTCFDSSCAYSLQYLDGSGFNATVGNDSFNLAGFQFKQVFGLITEENNPNGGEFEPFPVDGIAGFAYRDLSEVFAPTMIDSMVAAGEINDIFSLCFNQTSGGGVLTIGAEGSHYTGNIVYTPIIQKAWYTVNLTDVSVFGQSIGISPSVYNQGDTIVDSGTTLLYFPWRAYKALAAAFKNSCPDSHLKGVCEGTGSIFEGYCVSLTPSDIANYPEIVFTFAGGVSVSLPPNYYLLKGYCSSDEYALGISGEMIYDGTILGDTFMLAFENIFDRQNSRMGFAPVANCP